jgi:hypothetical protein
LLFGLSGVLIALWLSWLCTQGFDLTDESFYLIWMANPWHYPVSVSQFGFVLHPFYLLFDGDVANLRRANVAISMLFGTWLAYICLMQRANRLGRVELFMLSLAIGSTALVLFDNGLITPSYNSLTLQGQMLAAAGLIMTEHPNATTCAGNGKIAVRLMPAVMLGVGGALVFLAKPSSASLLAFVAIAYLVAAGKWHWRNVGPAGALAALLLILWVITVDGSAPAFSHRIGGGLIQAARLGGGHSLIDIFRVDIPHLDQLAQLMIGDALLLVLICRSAMAYWSDRWPYIHIVGAGGTLLYISLLLSGNILSPLFINQFQELVILAVPAIAMLFLLWPTRAGSSARSGPTFVAVATWASAAMMGIMPFVFAFGTNAHYWQSAGKAAIFWLLGGLLLLPQRWGPFLSAMIGVALTACLLVLGVQSPYRQPAGLTKYSGSLVIQDHMLSVDRDFAAQIDIVRSNASLAGFEAGGGIIDLTGQSPGLVHLLRGRAMGQPWLIGGYRGSLAYAQAALKMETCNDLVRSWLLVEMPGERALPDGVLATFGANRNSDYIAAGSWMTAAGYRDGALPRRQYLLRPKREIPSAEDACKKARGMSK